MIMRLNGHDKVYIKSDTFFNDPDCGSMYEDMGMDVVPIDAFGGFVPQNKSLTNLKKTEETMQKRFNLYVESEVK